MKTITKISSKSLAKLFGLMYAIFGLIAGLFMFIAFILSSAESEGGAGILFGIAAPIFLPIIYGLMGWIGGYITGGIYNVLAKRVGGIQMEVE